MAVKKVEVDADLLERLVDLVDFYIEESWRNVDAFRRPVSNELSQAYNAARSIIKVAREDIKPSTDMAIRIDDMTAGAVACLDWKGG